MEDLETVGDRFQGREANQGKRRIPQEQEFDSQLTNR
jgi:hypothetical protein